MSWRLLWGPGAKAEGDPATGHALTHRAQSQAAGNGVHRQTPTQQVINQGQGTASSKRRWRQTWGWRPALLHHHWGRDWWPQGADMESWVLVRVGGALGRGSGPPRPTSALRALTYTSLDNPSVLCFCFPKYCDNNFMVII